MNINGDISFTGIVLFSHFDRHLIIDLGTGKGNSEFNLSH